MRIIISRVLQCSIKRNQNHWIKKWKKGLAANFGSFERGQRAFFDRYSSFSFWAIQEQLSMGSKNTFTFQTAGILVKLDKRKSRMTHTVPNFVFSFPFRPNTWPAVHQRPYKKFQVSGVVELSRHVPELDICIFPSPELPELLCLFIAGNLEEMGKVILSLRAPNNKVSYFKTSVNDL